MITSGLNVTDDTVDCSGNLNSCLLYTSDAADE